MPADTDSCKIVRRENLLRLLRQDLESRTASYSPVQVDAMADLLQLLTNVSAELKAQQSMRSKRASREKPVPSAAENSNYAAGITASSTVAPIIQNADTPVR